MSSGLSGVYAGVGVGEVLSEADVWGRMSGVVEVLSAWAEDRDPLTDERIEKKRGKMGIAGRGGNVSNRATGREFSKSAIKAS